MIKGLKRFGRFMTVLLAFILILQSISSIVAFAKDDVAVITYIVGRIKSVDPLSGQVKIDNSYYEVTDDFDFTSATKHWVEKQDTPIVCKLLGNEISEFYSQDDICDVSISTSITPNSIFSKNGKLNVNTFELKVKIAYVIDGNYDFIFDSVLNKLSLYCNSIEIEAQSDALNFGSSGFWWFKNYNSKISENMNYSIFAGSSYNKTFTVYLNDNYRLNSVNSLLNVNTTLKYEGGEKSTSSQISVGSLDVEQERRTENKTSSKLDNDVSIARKQLDQNARNAVLYDGKLDAYLTIEQQKHIKEVLFVWVSDIFATASSDYCKQNSQVKDYVYNKLGIDKKYLTDLINTHATFNFELNTQIGKRIISFDLELTNYSFGGKPSYAGFGNLKYKMYKNNTSQIDCQGSGLVALSDMESFTNQLIEIANDQIKSVFKNTIGNDLDKIATYLTEGTMVQVLKDAGVIKGSFSDNMYKMLSKPTENHLDIEINCPVDVYIYDSNKSLVGKIINDRIDTNNDVFTFVNGNSKHIYLYDEAYVVRIVGNDNGKMDYIVNEISSEGEILRKLSYENLSVENGVAYNVAIPSASLLANALYSPLNSTNTSFSPTHISEENIYDDIEPRIIYSDKCGDNVYFDFYSNGFCRIYGEGSMYEYEIETGVEGINAPTTSPFYSHQGLPCKQVLIEDGVTTVGKNAFRGDSLEYIFIGDDVKSLGEYSIYNCKNLKKVWLGKSVEKIGLWAFSYSNSIESIAVDDDNPYLKTVGGGLLSKDGIEFLLFAKSSADSYLIPDGVSIIKEDAFGDCVKLNSVTIPASVLEIKAWAFDGCTNLADVNYLDAETEWKFIKIDGGNECLQNATIHYSPKPTGIIYPKKLDLNCSELSIEIGKSESLIPTFFPSYTTQRTLTWFSNDSSIATVSNGVVSGIKYGTTTITAKTTNGISVNCIVNVIPVNEDDFNYTIFRNPGEEIEVAIHGYNGSAKSLFIPSRIEGHPVKSIWDDAFKDCTSLKTVVIPTGVEYIGDNVFEGCTNLESITIPNSVKGIGYGSFYNCEKLKSITIPEGVTEIEGWTFCNCQSLESVTIHGSITDIDSHAFCDCFSLKEFTIPSTVTKMGEQVFWGCSELTQITIPSGIKEIEYATFKNCSKLKDVYFSGSKSQWEAIVIQEENECLTNANIHFGIDDNVNAVKITLNKTALTLEIGKTDTLVPTISPSNTTDKTVTWSSSNTSVATVSNGKVTAVKAGTASITAKTSNGKTATCAVSVISISSSAEVGDVNLDGTVSISDATEVQKYLAEYIDLSDGQKALADTNGDDSVTISDATEIQKYLAEYIDHFNQPSAIGLSSTNISLNVGSKQTLTATITPSDVTNKSISWTTSDSSIATVSNGVVTAVSPGIATITAKTYNGKSAKCTITVKQVEPTSITLNKSSLSLNEGDTYQLSATIYPSNAANKTVTWTSSNTSVVSVDSNGRVSAKAIGSATITAKTVNNKVATCTITVSPIEAVSIGFNNGNIYLKPNGTYRIYAVIKPDNATDKSVYWESSNKSVATVDGYGNVLAKSPGTATITAWTSNNKSTSCMVTVLPVSVSSISLNSYSVTLNEGESYQLSATISPADATDKTLMWRSSDSSIATVSNIGLVVAKSSGTVSIIAESINGKTAVCSVTVIKSILPESIEVLPPRLTLTVGESLELNPKIKPDNAEDKSVTWSSSKTNAVSVDSNGKITAKKAGMSSIITARTVNGLTSTVTVDTVNKAEEYTKYWSFGVKYDGNVYTAPYSQGPYYVKAGGEDLYYILNLDSELYIGAKLKLYITSGSSGTYDTHTISLNTSTYDNKSYKGYIPISQYLNYHNNQYIRVYTEVILANGQVVKPANLGTNDAIYLYMD